MPKTFAFLVVVLFPCCLSAQSLRYIKGSVPLASANDFHILQRGQYTHIWMYNSKKVTLHVYDEKLNELKEYSMKWSGGENVYFEPVSFKGFYYLLIPNKKSAVCYYVSDDGLIKTVDNAVLGSTNLNYVEKQQNKLLAAETMIINNTKLVLVIHQMDSLLRPIQKQYLQVDQNSSEIHKVFFKAYDDSTVLIGHVITKRPAVSSCHLYRMSLLTGQLQAKNFVSYETEFDKVTPLVDYKKNIYLVNQVFQFPQNNRAFITSSAYITKITPQWQIDSSISLQQDTSGKGFVNQNAYLLDDKLVSIDYCYDSLINPDQSIAPAVNNTPVVVPGAPAMNITVDDPRRTSGSQQDRQAFLSSRDLSARNTNEYTQFTSQPKYLSTNVPSSKIEKLLYRQLTVVDADLAKMEAIKFDVPVPSVLFQGTDRLIAFYGQGNVLHSYDITKTGFENNQQYELNPLYKYVYNKITRMDDGSLIIPYVFKTKLHFLKAYFK